MVKRIYVEHKTLRNLDGEPVIVYGAGFTGRTVIEALMHDDSAYMRPVAVVDDNPQLAVLTFIMCQFITPVKNWMRSSGAMPLRK